LETEPSRWTIVQLKIGAVGYVVGVAAWSLFWLGIAWNYVGRWWLNWLYPGFFVVALSLIMVGVGCFGLGKLYGNMLAVVTGVTNVIAAVPFFIMGLFNLPPFAPRVLYIWPHGYISFIGNGLLIASVLLWTLTTSSLTRASFRRLRTVISIASLVSAIVFLLLFPILGWISFGLTLFTQPYALAQVLSAVLLHKIGSDVQRKLHDSKQA
jgi:hypothetical protein